MWMPIAFLTASGAYVDRELCDHPQWALPACCSYMENPRYGEMCWSEVGELERCDPQPLFFLAGMPARCDVP